MPWEMYQLFFSDAAELRPGPRYRLLTDALAHAELHPDGQSFAIRAPDGSWHRTPEGRAIFGRGGSGSHKELEAAVEAQAIPPIIDDDDDDTEPFGSGSGNHRTSRSRKRPIEGTGPISATEGTDPPWPPDE